MMLIYNTYIHVVYFRHNRSIEVKKLYKKHAKIRNKKKKTMNVIKQCTQPTLLRYCTTLLTLPVH